MAGHRRSLLIQHVAVLACERLSLAAHERVAAAYEAALASLGIGHPLASQVVPAVLQLLAEAGYMRERDILARAID